MAEIRILNREEYKGKQFTARYRTKGYLDIEQTGDAFKFVRKHFATEVEKSFNDTFFGDWLDNPTAYGAFDGDILLGYVEGVLEDWKNRYRISNICVFDATFRNRGIGRMLMQTILKDAKNTGARMVVLETQTCNLPAIAFYNSFGFEIIGFDLFAYSNNDPAKKEVRIEMGKSLY